jgi:hypothetical protein
MDEHRLLQYLILDRRWKAVPQDDDRFTKSSHDVLVTVGAIENAGPDLHFRMQALYD